jgi:hypothetical protein
MFLNIVFDIFHFLCQYACENGSWHTYAMHSVLSSKSGVTEAYVKRLMLDKLTPKSDKCFFVGYPRETKGYYFYNKSEGKVFVARNGVLLEKEFLSKGVSGSKVQLEKIWDVPETVLAPTEPSQDE